MAVAVCGAERPLRMSGVGSMVISIWFCWLFMNAVEVHGDAILPAPAQVSAQAMMRAFLDGDYGRRKQKGGSFYLGDGYFSAGCAARALA